MKNNEIDMAIDLLKDVKNHMALIDELLYVSTDAEMINIVNRKKRLITNELNMVRELLTDVGAVL